VAFGPDSAGQPAPGRVEGAHSTIAPALARAVACVAFLLGAAAAECALPPVVVPYEKDAPLSANNAIDDCVLALLRQRGIEPARLCSDAVFIRRAYLDVIGTLPEPGEVWAFLNDSDPHKREALIDRLLDRPEFADYWSLKWCDLLRVKSEFPVKLWPNAVQAYHRWIHEALAENMPYDRFVRALLTSSGSNFRVPPVNFYRAVEQRTAAGIARAVALTFMGTRIASWPQDRREGMEAFFSRIAYKGTAEWKEEIVIQDPAPTGPLEATLPDGTGVVIPPDKDPREVFADWLIRQDNPWFARNIVNRIWAWLMGRGIIHEPDDIRPDNPPANLELLALLEKELATSGYDLKHIYRLILNSRTYQQSCIPRSDDPDAAKLFAYYLPRQLDAEVLSDALCWLAGDGESYSSAVPEPYTFIPRRQRSILLADGSITSEFLELFGRPSRDRGLESERSNTPTPGQRLHFLNSTHVQHKIARSVRIAGILRTARGDRRRIVRRTYMTVLSRLPTRDELDAALTYWQESGLPPAQALQDLAWALINSKEFLYRH